MDAYEITDAARLAVSRTLGYKEASGAPNSPNADDGRRFDVKIALKQLKMGPICRELQ